MARLLVESGAGPRVLIKSEIEFSQTHFPACTPSATSERGSGRSSGVCHDPTSFNLSPALSSVDAAVSNPARWQERPQHPLFLLLEPYSAERTLGGNTLPFCRSVRLTDVRKFAEDTLQTTCELENQRSSMKAYTQRPGPSIRQWMGSKHPRRIAGPLKTRLPNS